VQIDLCDQLALGGVRRAWDHVRGVIVVVCIVGRRSRIVGLVGVFFCTP
jgi:hypothetical protein